MKITKPSIQRSLFTFASFILVSSVIISCATPNPDASAENTAARAGEVPDEVSLKADRSEMDEARKNIPDSVKKENDEVAAILAMMSTPDEEPSKVREKFNKALRTKRDKNDKILRTRREEFMKKQRTDREAFLKKTEQDRKAYLKDKHSQDDRKAFFDKQEDARKAFFADASDKMKDFESKLTEDRKTFEDYARERQNQFNAQLRAYSENFQERKNALEKKRRAEDKARELERRKSNGSATESDAGSTEQPWQSNDTSSNPGGAGNAKSGPLDEWKSIPKTPGTELAPKGK
jgi:hypothetical protein